MRIILNLNLTRIFNEMAPRDCKNGRAIGKPQGVGSEVYLIGTSQRACPELAEGTPEEARKDGHICSRSRRFVKHAGWMGKVNGFNIHS